MQGTIYLQIRVQNFLQMMILRECQSTTLHLRETKYMPVTDVNSKRKNTANISAVSLGIQLIRIIITVMMTVILIR